MAKRTRHDLFRIRLHEAMTAIGMSKSALARATGVDRSTIGQLFKNDVPRMPNAQLAADIAFALGISADWLLGLTNQPEKPGDILASALSLSPAERTSADQQILDWHREVAGRKVRHVPATLPEMLKTDHVLAWEYSSLPSDALDQVKSSASALLDWVASGGADYEIAMPVHELQACAEGSGYYATLPPEFRRDQLTQLAQHVDDMFPRLRLFLFDAHQLYSAPVTVFGNGLAILYVGQCYLTLREPQRVSALTDHFDWLVRGSTVDAREAAEYITSLRDGQHGEV